MDVDVVSYDLCKALYSSVYSLVFTLSSPSCRVLCVTPSLSNSVDASGHKRIALKSLHNLAFMRRQITTACSRCALFDHSHHIREISRFRRAF